MKYQVLRGHAPLLTVLALNLLVASSASRIFESSWSASRVLIATILVAAPAAMTSLRSFGRRIAYVVVTIVTVTFAILEAKGSIPGDLVGSVSRGGGEILSGLWPARPDPASVGFVTLLACISSSLSAETTRRHAIGPARIAPPTLLLGLLAFLAAEAGAPSVALLAVFVVLAGLVLKLAAVQRLDHETSRLDAPVNKGDAWPTIALVLAMVSLIPVAAGGVMKSGRLDPRDQRIDSVVPDEDVSPLALVDGWRALTPSVTLFESSGSDIALWRLVALTRYNGRAWASSDSFRRSGARLDAQSTLAEKSSANDLSVTVRMAELGGRWLPTPAAQPRRVSVAVRTDVANSGLLVDRPLASGDTYKVSTAARPEVPATADRATSSDIVATEIPVEISSLASQIVQGATNDRERAERIAAFLRDGYQLDESAPSGHALPIVKVFLQKTKKGRTEQFVSAYALLARSIGLPVRISVGFLGQPGTITTAQATAWAEVEFRNVGWVAQDALPASTSTNSVTTRTDSGLAQEQSIAPSTTAPKPPDQNPEKATGDEPSSVSATGVAAIAVPLLVVLGVLGYVGMILGIKYRRRRKHPTSDPNSHIINTFLVGSELLTDLGADQPRGRTNRELVNAGAKQVDGATKLSHLAALATEARFSPRLMDDEDVRLASEGLADFESAIREQGRIRWWRARLSPRSIRRNLR